MLHIFTLSWNGLHLLKPLKESLLPTLNGIEYTWHIKDNGSTDGTQQEIITWPGVMAYCYPNNLQNFSEGMNYLFESAKPNDEDYILLLNNDVVFNDLTSIHKMMSQMNSDVGVVGARLLFTDTNLLQHAGVVFDPSHKMPVHFRAGQKTDKQAERNREFQVVTGAVLLTKAIYYKACGDNKSGRNGLDENLVWSFDDVSACLSIKYNLNKKIIYCGETNIFHRESFTLKTNPMNKLFMTHNVNYFRNKWYKKYNLDKLIYDMNPDYGVINDK